MTGTIGLAGSAPSAAFFDLDRTLISGSSAFTLAVQARRAGLIRTTEFAVDAAGAVAFKLFGASDDTSEQVRQRILSAVTGMRRSDLQALNAEVLPRLIERVRPEAKRLLERHHHTGRDTFIVSAAPVELVEPLARALGMPGGIGTRSAVEDGVYTGELDGPFCYGEGKVEAIAELVAERGYDLVLSYAYSDSSSDLPMLELVGHPVAVNPDSRLERHARLHAWPVVIFSERTKWWLRRALAGVGTVGVGVGGFALGTQVGRRRSPRFARW